MLAQAFQNQIPFRYVLNDLWFASAENMRYVKLDLGKEFIMALKANRNVALSLADKHNGHYQRLDQLDLPEATPTEIYLAQVPFALHLLRQVFTNADGSTGVRYLVTSDLTLHADQLLTIYQKRWKVEIVFTQMTKARLLAFEAGRDNVTNFNLAIINNDSINQEFDQLTALRKGELVQRGMCALAKILNTDGQLGHIKLFLHLDLQLAQLVRQARLGLSQFLPFALKLWAANDLGQKDFQQPGLLPVEVSQRRLKSFAARLERLGQPFASLRPFQFMRNESWLRQNFGTGSARRPDRAGWLEHSAPDSVDRGPPVRCRFARGIHNRYSSHGGCAPCRLIGTGRG